MDYKRLLEEVKGVEAMSGTIDYLMANYGLPRDAFVQGEGSYLFREDGSRVLDFLSGIAVTSLGHSYPSVVNAIATQAQKLMHTSNFFANENGPKVAFLLDQLISSVTPTHERGKVFFSNSGAEAMEAAIKLARRRQGFGRYQFITINGAFHGRTFGALSATAQPGKKEAFEPVVPGFNHVDAGDIEAVSRLLSTGEVAAVIIESIQGESGVRPLDSGFVRSLREVTKDSETLLILDEVQTGLGRCGSWFDFSFHDIAPDIVVMAKALGSGFPIGATWARRSVADAFIAGDHGTTYGGNPLATASALATLIAMIEIDAPTKAREMGSELTKGLERIDGVETVRGRGLLIGVEVSGVEAPIVARLALEGGLIVNPIGGSTIRLAPPLTVSLEEIEEATRILSDAIKLAS
ncbi:MAG: aminotransferase class III-fold pyridoxal phosphate-dependent enzyme [Actinomycetota bacterium]|nr:aminotransferase class III-fold pyridoxal phosphate-dependent enzyme [Actinomycetota bacterium]